VIMLVLESINSLSRTQGRTRCSRTASFFFFFFTLVTGPRRSLSRKLSDTSVYELQIRARLGTAAHFCEVVVLKSSNANAGPHALPASRVDAKPYP